MSHQPPHWDISDSNISKSRTNLSIFHMFDFSIRTLRLTNTGKPLHIFLVGGHQHGKPPHNIVSFRNIFLGGQYPTYSFFSFFFFWWGVVNNRTTCLSHVSFGFHFVSDLASAAPRWPRALWQFRSWHWAATGIRWPLGARKKKTWIEGAFSFFSWELRETKWKNWFCLFGVLAKGETRRRAEN